MAFAYEHSRIKHHVVKELSVHSSLRRNAWAKMFGIQDRQMGAIVDDAESMINNTLSLMENDLKQKWKHAKHLNKKLKKLDSEIARSKKRPDGEEKRDDLDGLYAWRARVLRDQQINENRIKEIEERIATRTYSICVGSKRMFRKQFHLEENGYESLDEWIKDWREVRSRQFSVLGSSTETGGCQLCVLQRQEDGRYSVKLSMLTSLEEEYGKHITLTNIEIPHKSEMLLQAVMLNELMAQKRREVYRTNKLIKKENKEREKEDQVPTLKEADCLKGMGHALNYRFLKDDRGWRLFITLRQPEVPSIITDRSKGSLGVDFNADHLAHAEINGSGNLVQAGTITLLPANQVSSMQNRTQVEEACKSLVRKAYLLRKPIIIEDLDFEYKKYQMTAGQNVEKNRMLSALSYRLFRETVIRQAMMLGVEVILVNPAYTSLLGELKYMNQVSSVHMAASIVIARRGCGFRERIPKQFPIQFRMETRTFRLPEECLKGEDTFQTGVRDVYRKWHRTQVANLREKYARNAMLHEMEDALSYLDASFSVIRTNTRYGCGGGVTASLDLSD